MQYKNKKNLYKIIFITILLGFIISLAGCNWLSLGLLNSIDPQAQIRVNYNTTLPTIIIVDEEEDTSTIVFYDEDEYSINLEIFCLNGVEFNITGFSYEYSVFEYGTSQNSFSEPISELSRIVENSFYVEPSTETGTPGPKKTIEMPLIFTKVIDYFWANPFVTEVVCDLKIIGVDGAGHNLTITVGSNIPVIQYGIDIYSPYAEIQVTPDTIGIAPFSVVLDASASFDNRGIASISWDFGDETTGADITENHTYATPGAYNVILTVTDFYGNTGYDTVTIIVNEPKAPIAVITTVPDPPTGSAPFTVYFDAYGSDDESEAEIISYTWDFGDGSLAIGVTTNHEYSNVGTYTAILTVTDSNGKKGYDSKEIVVEKAPEAVINTTPEPPTGVAPFTVYFDAYDSTSESGIVSYAWDFGDGSSGGTGITTNHTYTVVGTYTVILTITDSNGYEAYDSVKVTVKEFESEATVVLTANPLTISPGGSSAIIAYCTDDSGNEVPNGTVVAFGTIGGGTLTVNALGLTINGIATASLKIDSVSTVTVLATTIYASGSVTVTCE